ncbi:SH3 domain-binding protein 5-like [Mytilus californianus]|uniref:SH3 domain-binding protein 5-like n=1 Tax=Mytilus californianus TaxID=6549 RepID=UPI002245AAAA|nr:SH3 domain-binding protein 5-like [Mytilus californianus]
MLNSENTCLCDIDEEDLDSELEPEIKEELDHLNHCSAEINRLENEIDEARTKYRQTFHETSNRMSLVSQKRRKSIAKAREYFELKHEGKQAQGESLKAARQYQSAIGIYRAAKETVALAEDKLVKGGECQLSSAWQEMLNHATERVMESELEKRRSEDHHLKMTKRCGQLENQLRLLERSKKRYIANARSYFEMKHQLDLKLQQQKQNVTDLQSAIKQAKGKYAKSLRKLEEISLAIHESRRNKLLLMYPRQPGVGAECDSLHSTISELALESIGKDYEMVNDISNEDDEICDGSDYVEEKFDDGCSHSSNKTDDEKDIDLTNVSSIFENLQISDD